MPTIDLQELVQDIFIYNEQPRVEVKGLALDSRAIKAGDIFFACKGTQLDGRQYIDDAIKKGVCAVLADADDDRCIVKREKGVPIIYIPQLSHHMGSIAARFYEYPSKKMQVIGVTGTNGKTSISHLMASVLHELGSVCGVIGTLGNGLYGQIHESGLTTPDAVTLQKNLAEFVSRGAHYTVMEVSSHSLDQGRVNGVDFSVGIYTNLTRDHLDYHGTMENYGRAKKRLFESDKTQCAVINVDDEFGMQIISELHAKKKIYAYSVNAQNQNSVPCAYADNIRLDLSGITADIHTPWGSGELKVNLIGKFNLSNVLAVLITLCVLNFPFEKVLQAISQLKPVDGRMQTLGGGDYPLVVIDYSHTPDALEKALTALRYHCHGKLYCVFGCGGDRDRGKRPMMAKIAEQLSDVVIVTDDNPRTEDSGQIFDDIKAGFLHSDKVIMVHDRAKAIRDAISIAKAGDCILIAGKGAENYQIIGKVKHPFQDREQAAACLHINEK